MTRLIDDWYTTAGELTAIVPGGTPRASHTHAEPSQNLSYSWPLRAITKTIIRSCADWYTAPGEPVSVVPGGVPCASHCQLDPFQNLS